LLQAGARRPIGTIGSDLQLGAGALDVAGTMDAYDAREAAIARDPDASASWLTLSNAYLHPDAGPPLVGTVEVRAADGSIADGFAPGRLTLAIGGEGSVDQPLERVAPGLYRFAVRAHPDTGVRFLRLDVAVDGVPVGAPGSRVSGHRLIPIGADRWIASGSPRIYGGCSVSSRSRSAGSAFSMIVLAAVAVTRRCRRRIPRGAPPLR
jgi:hypothetical protein